ncbi:MAG: acetate--CoA ligase family protein [Nitrososphaerales archaeon]|nr:acetate--CoA ligase family protein [Nitrososphaerales archaeon]
MERKKKVLEIIEGAIKEGRNILLEYEGKLVCMEHGIPTPRFFFAKDLNGVLNYGAVLNYPLVIKVVSPDIIHKSDVGGVELNLKDEDELHSAYQRILKNVRERVPNARILGVLVEEMVPSGIEVVVGMLRDRSFGPTIMFGLGGIFIEVLKDVSFRVAPLSSIDAEEMINEIKGRRVLDSFRGSPPVDIDALKNVILTLSELSITYPEFLQIDLNPIIVRGKDLKVVDTRIILCGHKVC